MESGIDLVLVAQSEFDMTNELEEGFCKETCWGRTLTGALSALVAPIMCHDIGVKLRTLT